MNDYDLSKVEAPSSNNGNISPYMTYGDSQVLKINTIELKFSRNSNSPKAILHMETRPINEPGFTPIEGAQGKVGKVGCGVYMNSDLLKREFLQKMKMIAAALGLEEHINKIRSEDFEEVVKKIADLLGGNYARYTVVASEYQKDGGKIGITLSLPKFKFVESEDADPSTIVKFDKNNPYHYKKIVAGAPNGYGGKYEGSSFGPTGGSKYSGFQEHIPDNPNDPDVSDLPF